MSVYRERLEFSIMFHVVPTTGLCRWRWRWLAIHGNNNINFGKSQLNPLALLYLVYDKLFLLVVQFSTEMVHPSRDLLAQ